MENIIEINKQTSDTKIWNIYTNIEKMYAKFIENKSVRTYRCPTKRIRKTQNWNGETVLQYSYL